MIPSYFRTPLHLAIEKELIELASHLIEARANLNIQDSKDEYFLSFLL